ncbi:hypothetical protein C0431_14695 [bacterium]|nr:hypothetical protein [bacterium]
MMLRTILVVMMLWGGVIGWGQSFDENPLIVAAKQFGAKGLGKDVDSGSALKYAPNGKLDFKGKYLKKFESDKEIQDFYKQVFDSGFEEFRKQSIERKAQNDAAYAYAFSVNLMDSIIQGEEASDEMVDHLAGQVRAALKSVIATDAQKQEFAEWALCESFVVVGFAAALGETEDSLKKLMDVAEATFTTLTGAEPERARRESGILLIAADPVSSANTSEVVGGLAPGFSFSVPSGWESKEGWIVGSMEHYGNMVGANIRMLPAMKPTSDLGATLRSLWKQNTPKGLVNNFSGMVFRRYVGDGVPAHFICGRGQQDGETWDSLFSLYIVDCGDYWQPFVLAQTWWDPSGFAPGASMTASLSYGGSADLGEVFLKTIRNPKTKGAALVDASALVGDFHFGSGASMNWVNVYSGATSTTFVSSGGSLSLAKNGTFTYTYSSASGAVGATIFRKATGKGNWTLQGDILTCKWTQYDQGDGYQVKDYVYRVAGVVVFEGGERVLVLKQDLDKPINAVTVTDSADYFTTRKKG